MKMNRNPMLELDSTSYPEWRDGIVKAELNDAVRQGEPRTYPAFPRWPLDIVRLRLWGSLDRALVNRRSWREMDNTFPTRRTLSRLLQFSHGISGPMSSGPVPSAGGFQALELYAVVLEETWLPTGLYHYDRTGHHLSQIAPRASRNDWTNRIPSIDHVRGGSLLWVLVGDGERVARKYGERSERFLLQEAGHLMQNLCLMSASLDLATVPLGGYFERDIAREFQLLTSDLVLYVGLCGRPIR
jgi:SagB-type dehydrogenase family enzyme